MSAVQDYYQTLGLRHGASDEDIKKAFKKLAIKYHPDKTDDKHHHAMFIKINEAYETLKEADTRREYDKTHGFSSSYTAAPSYTSFATQNTTSSTSSTFTYSYGSSFRDSYYGMYQHYYRSPFSNIFAKARPDNQEQEKKKKPFESRYKSELEEFNERLRRARKDNYNLSDHSNPSTTNNENPHDSEDKEYVDRKQEEMRRQWESPFRQYDPDKVDQEFVRNSRNAHHESPTPTHKGEDQSDPIVVEEASGESDDEFVTVVEDLDESSSANPSPSARPTPLFQARTSLRSPEKPSNQFKANARTSFMRNDPPKRPKKNGFEFDDLKSSLGTSIDEVDLKEILDSLPDQKRQRSASSQQTGLDTKRPKYEYLDGTSKADTLHKPVNKSSHSAFLAAPQEPKSGLSQEPLTMLDLHASDKIHQYDPPVPPNVIVEPRMAKETWEKYVSDIQKYERQFLDYKQHIVQYQFERSKKDAQYYEIINSQAQSFETYQQCLNQDVEVLQKYLDLLRIYTTTMEVYKQNCKWMQLPVQNTND